MRINQIQLFLFMGYDNPFIAIEFHHIGQQDITKIHI